MARPGNRSPKPSPQVAQALTSDSPTRRSVRVFVDGQEA